MSESQTKVLPAPLDRLIQWRDVGDGPVAYTAGDQDFAHDVVWALGEIDRLTKENKGMKDASITKETPEEAWARACEFMRGFIADFFLEEGEDLASDRIRRKLPDPPSYLPVNPKVMSDA
jgi:hypothetical protein